jgi:hypothetical protein
VVYTAPMTGVDFLVNTITGVNSCPAGHHPAQAWEAMILDVVGETYVATQTAWVTGSFPT